MSNKIDELNELLKQALDIAEKDRKMAIDNYNTIKKQLEIIHEGAEMTEDAKLEAELNKALKLVFESGARMDNVIKSITLLMGSIINSETQLQIADKLGESQARIATTKDVSKLLNS